ncbi:MAG: hypothetical protein V7719_12685 [Psychroserpens sp.]|uniref:hypothetical protein n=1 Tax=Psychroserpens sp. TaxID=2020870 RepID=UPI003001AF3B
MYRLSSIILCLFSVASIYAQSPHGDKLKVNCNQCHNPSGWEMDVYLMRFDHNKTEFKLEGAHTQTDCKACHTSLVFDEAPNQCASCHNDIHSSSVGNDCIRCHTSNTWLVDNIPEIHEENGFPLIGSHGSLSCVDCHSSETNLRFDNIGNECISCHRENYLTTENPDHSNFSIDCLECHNPIGTVWETDNVGDHDFFPLTLGHDNLDCIQCHITNDFSDADPNCVSCHQSDYDTTTNPSHNDVGYSTDCASCHTTNPGWTPATIDHDFFPLTLGHDIQDCTQCHTTANYSDTDPNCVSCHQTDYDGSTDPNHSDAQFPTNCVTCHTTNPNWTPVTWNHNDFYPLNGAHALIVSDCLACHSAGYTNTPNTCVGCHLDDYNATTNPNHNGAQFPTDCMECHNETVWEPSTFDHDGQYFRINSGTHDGEWNSCIDCHTDANDYSVFTCITCHTQNETDNDHSEVNGYIYESNACLGCHPDS